MELALSNDTIVMLTLVKQDNILKSSSRNKKEKIENTLGRIIGEYPIEKA